MRYIALLLLLPAFASAQTIDIKRIGVSPCECRTMAGARISGHNSDVEGIDACGDLVLKDLVKRRFTCDFEISATMPVVVPPPVVPPSASGVAVIGWDVPQTNTDGSPLTDLSSFKIYYGTNPGSLDRVTPVIPGSTRSYTLTNLTPGTWYMSMTVTNAAGTESGRTNLASKTI